MVPTDDGDSGRAPRIEGGETSMRVREAMDGNAGSLSWVVARFSPLLLARAEALLGRRLRRICDPEDLVAGVWTVALPRLRGLPARMGRFTPVLMRFLATTLRFTFSNVLQRHGKRIAEAPSGPADDTGAGAPALDAGETGVVTQAMRREMRGAVAKAIEGLDGPSREVLLLRGFEQLSNAEIGEKLDLAPNTVAVRYRRALEKLRAALPDSVFAEFPD